MPGVNDLIPHVNKVYLKDKRMYPSILPYRLLLACKSIYSQNYSNFVDIVISQCAILQLMSMWIWFLYSPLNYLFVNLIIWWYISDKFSTLLKMWH